MKIPSWKCTWLILLVLMLAGTGIVYAGFSDKVSVKNNIKLGDINISLEEYTLRNGREYPYKNPRMILPGDRISKIPRITNEADTCWVRASLHFSKPEADLEALNPGHVTGMPNDWIKRGEYYYCTRALKKNDKVDLFTGIKIPSHWDSRYENVEMELEIRADAIQARNFTPDFQSMSPWGEEEIELCVHERDGAVLCRTDALPLTVEYSKTAYRLMAAPGDFFHNFGTLMPGDVCKDSIHLSNTTNREAKLYFHTGTETLSRKQQEVLEKLSLEISLNGNILYTGNLAGKQPAQPVLLGDFASGEEGTLDFTVMVPSELKNTYALRDASVVWTFAVEGEEAPLSPQAKETPAHKEDVDTGDESNLLLWVCLMLSALSAILLPVKMRGERKSEK